MLCESGHYRRTKRQKWLGTTAYFSDWNISLLAVFSIPRYNIDRRVEDYNRIRQQFDGFEFAQLVALHSENFLLLWSAIEFGLTTEHIIILMLLSVLKSPRLGLNAIFFCI